MVFRELYWVPCEEAFGRTSLTQDIPAGRWCQSIEDKVASLFLRMETESLPSAEVHKSNLRSLTRDWSNYKSTKRCLICLRRKPEHPQCCGHTICDICVRIFGRPRAGLEYRFDLSECVLCQSVAPLTVKQVPPTAFYRLLAIDGGGIGGCFSLEALSAIERTLNLPYPLQEEFDYTIGTSSGRL